MIHESPSKESKTQLPIVDFSKEYFGPGSSSWLSTSNEVRHALEEYGCFVAVYAKVNSQLTNDVFRASKELFDLPIETKVKNVSDNIYNYGYLKLPMIPLYESLGIRHATTSDGIRSFSNTMFPFGNDHFCKTMHLHANLLSELEQMVARMVFESYGVAKHYESHVKSMTYLLRLMKYRLPQKEETNIGAHVHTHKSFLTILHENQVGLEIKAKANEWIAMRIPPYCYLVMAGDALLAWSNDKIHSAFHQVIIKGEKERYSVGLFSFVNGIIEAPEELVDEEHPRQYKPFHHYDLLDFVGDTEDQLDNILNRMQAHNLNTEVAPKSGVTPHVPAQQFR